jgi:hypothetical protein
MFLLASKLIIQLPQDAAEAQLAALEFPQHAGEAAAGAGGEVPGWLGRDNDQRHGGIFTARDVASSCQRVRLMPMSLDKNSAASISVDQLLSS